MILQRRGADGISIVAHRAEYLKQTRFQINNINPTTQVLEMKADMAKQEDIERIAAVTLAEFVSTTKAIITIIALVRLTAVD